MIVRTVGSANPTPPTGSHMLNRRHNFKQMRFKYIKQEGTIEQMYQV